MYLGLSTEYLKAGKESISRRHLSQTNEKL